MSELFYVIETWRGDSKEPIKLKEDGFPLEHWHEHSSAVDLRRAIEEVLGYEESWGRKDSDFDWDEEMESMVPFAVGGSGSHLGFKIVLKDSDGTEKLSLIMPCGLPDDD